MSFLKILDTNFYKENSLVTAPELVKWKRSRGIYSFNKIPKTAIVSLNKNIIKPFVNLFNKKLKGINGSNYILKNDILLCSDFGSGAPAIITHMEELKALGTEQFVFVGLAGFINSSIDQNKPFIISSAHSSVGSSYFYSKNEILNPISQLWFDKIRKDLSIEQAVCWSTDNPFRETPSIINHYKNKGAELIEMECAAIYAFSEFHKIPSISILVSADLLSGNNWNPPENMNELLETQRIIISQLIKTL